MSKQETKGKALLEQVKKVKTKESTKQMDKILGKQKNKAKFNKVNFNG